MGLFNKLFDKTVKNKNGEDNSASKSGVDLKKADQELEKVFVSLSKPGKVDLLKHTAKVAFAMDYSGSMDWLCQNGTVQDTITRLLPIALRFDDDGELETWIFSDGKEKLKAVNLYNYKNYVKEVMLKAKMRMGGTNYAPALKDIANYYKKSSKIPAFIIFVTDGENFDKTDTDKIIIELSEYNMFIQFVGIGNERFSYLRSLDDMKGRKHDNTGFISIKDINEMNDEDLYTELLKQYINWLNGKQ